MGSDKAILHENTVDSLDGQGSLFDKAAKATENPNRRGFRVSDPITSRLAFEKLQRNGSCLKVNNDILRFLRSHPSEAFTYSEVAQAIRHDQTDTMRRLNELRHDHLVTNPSKRPCRVNGNKKLTWKAAPL